MMRIGVVVIGRNEGERLKRCLESAMVSTERVVYVDSGSTDGSVEFAKSIGVEVVDLDTSIAFTAARARNEGVARLIERWGDVEAVHMIDGDCTFVEGWIETASVFLEDHPKAAVVCGRRRERFPGASRYNRLCDLEWDTPIGVAKSCGGDAMFRLDAFNDAGGYRSSLIAGEEPELCVRIRAGGWTVHRLDHEMTLHDAAMTRFSQFWQRAKRAGHAYAEGAVIHGRGVDKHGVKQTRSAIVWGFVFPIVGLALAWWTFGISVLAVLGLYGAQGLRIRAMSLRQGRSKEDATLLAIFTMLAKPAQAMGWLLYWRRRVFKQQATLIEYKGAGGNDG
ncbi:MAG: glycosyltransferase family 2 protein [Phycisphaerales bacterium]|nr:glycosyltransferase family 2 protein [Phycisphaerales bacterium]